MALIISREQTEKLVDMPTALKTVEQLFRDRAEGKITSVESKNASTTLSMNGKTVLICFLFRSP